MRPLGFEPNGRDPAPLGVTPAHLLPPDAYQALLLVLTAVHGCASLEMFGHLAWFSDDARDELFEARGAR